MISIGLIICQCPESCRSIRNAIAMVRLSYTAIESNSYHSTEIGATKWLGILQQSRQVRHT